MRNILYLHGLESSNISPKVDYIKSLNYNVINPKIKYIKFNIFKDIESIILEKDINYIVGSSIGGYFGYYLSKLYNIPSLLFNPALPYRISINPIVDETGIYNPYMYIILGKLDTVINPKMTKNIVKNIPNIKIEEISNLEHGIPYDIFCQSFDKFILN